MFSFKIFDVMITPQVQSSSGFGGGGGKGRGLSFQEAVSHIYTFWLD